MKFKTYEVTFIVNDKDNLEQELWTKTWFGGNIINVEEKDEGILENGGGMI